MLKRPERPGRNGQVGTYGEVRTAQRFAMALERLNHLAHSLRNGSRLQAQVYATKHALVSAMLEAAIECRLSWQRQSNGRYLLLVSIDQLRCFHVRFDHLTGPAKGRVVRTIGPAPSRILLRLVAHRPACRPTRG